MEYGGAPDKEPGCLDSGGVVEGEGIDSFPSLLEFELKGLGDQLCMGVRQREKLGEKA